MADAVLALAVVLLGRWAAGPSFGAVLWCGVTVPLIAAGDGRRGMSVGWQTATVFGVTLAGTCGLIAMGHLSAWLSTLWLLTSVGVLLGAAARCGRRPAKGAILACVIWFGVPCWIDSGWSDWTAGYVIAVHPVTALNAVWPSLGDASHQALAYRWLTRLGQDVSFTYPNSVWPSISLHAGVAVVLSLCSTWNKPNKPDVTAV